MNYQVLARKWRPHNFKEVVGQQHVVQSLINALQHNRLHHAYLFTGTRGVGKTTLARILAKAINCENLQDNNPCDTCLSCREINEGRYLDLIEVDAASRTKVEDTRDLLDNAQYAPNQGRYKVYIIDEVHMLSGHSFNALLKTLEEPPEHVKFLLATTDPQKIPVTILSRCLQFNLKQLSPSQIFSQMEFILTQEKIDFEAPALKSLSRAADGSMRDGLSLLDQAIVFGNGKVQTSEVNNMLGTVALQPIDDILLALANNDAVAILNKIAEIDDLNPNFADVLQQILQVLHRVALTQHIPNFIDENFDSEIINTLATQLAPEDIQLFYQIGLMSQKDLSLAPDPRSGFEMVMLRMLTFKPVSLDQKAPQISSKPATRPERQSPPVAVTAKPVTIQAPSTPEITVATIIDEKKTEPAPLATQTFDANTASWPVMIAAMRLNGMTKEFANHCVLDSINEHSCTLIINPGHVITNKAQETLQKALQSYTGSTGLKLNIKSEKTTLETPAVQIIRDRENLQQASVNAINSDPNILSLKSQFDARILPGTIEPVITKEENQ
ncbi:MAG: DNA polymerase III subunit gamma/tau [Methylococcales bacterium]|nr:DNA polymerase III subunit gamma/tau [Methylococcales bacterium]